MLNRIADRVSNFFTPRLRPVEINIVSVDNKSEKEIKTSFHAKFRMGSNAFRGLYFDTKGTFETDQVIDNRTLIQILETTDLDKYVELNLKGRDVGEFSYFYHYNDNSLRITFSTF